ncbi:DoxX family protein [bacterium]|nr:DoxX family protein [bacterium]
MYTPSDDKRIHAGLLVLRIGIGAMFLYHGIPKLLAGPPRWSAVGGAMALFGIKFAPAFWGFMASVAEGVGGALLIAGLFTRCAAFFMFFTMVVAAATMFSKGGMADASHAALAGIVFFSLLVSGPGRYSFDEARWRK